MNLKEDLDAVLSGAKEIGGEFQTALTNALGNPTLATILYDLISSHVEVAKVVQQTPPGQKALADLRAKQAAARAAAAPAQPAQAAAPVVDTAAIAQQVLAQLLPLLQASQQSSAPVADENPQA